MAGGSPQMDAPPAGGYGGGPSSRDFGPALEVPSPGRSLGPFVTAAAMIVGLTTILLLVIVGCRRSIDVAKTAEVRQELSTIAVAAARVYERDHRVCPSASIRVPTDAQFQSGKYQSSPRDWLVDADRNAGFACLGFEMTRPQHFQYGYEATPSGFIAIGHGDLNADGITSEFTWTGHVAGDHLVLAKTITERNTEE